MPPPVTDTTQRLLCFGSENAPEQVEKLFITNSELRRFCQRVFVVGKRTSYIFDFNGLRRCMEHTYLTAAEEETKEQRDAEDRAWTEGLRTKGGWEIDVEGKLVAPAALAVKAFSYVELLKRDGPSGRDELRKVRDPATGRDHRSVSKIFDLCSPRSGNRWTMRSSDTEKIHRWVGDHMPKMKCLRFVPPRRRTMQTLKSPPRSGAGRTDRTKKLCPNRGRSRLFH